MINTNTRIKITKTIELSNLALMLHIGVHPEERQNPQKLLVSVSVRVHENEENDDIKNTLDYDKIYHFLKRLEDADHFDLQETVCRKVLDYVLGMNDVEQVIVSTKKIDIFDDTEYVGLTMCAENCS